MTKLHHNQDPLHPHAHDPNPEPPSADATFVFVYPDSREETISVPELEKLPLTRVSNCYIVSTDHGTSGPFTFAGASLLDLVQNRLANGEDWSQVEVISADGFGNRVLKAELLKLDPAGPIVLSYLMDGEKMSRQQGLVRMIVPSEKDDALRQVKWVGRVVVRE